MTLLDDYRRAVYNDQRKRKLKPLPSRPVQINFTLTPRSSQKSHGKKVKTGNMRLDVLDTAQKEGNYGEGTVTTTCSPTHLSITNQLGESGFFSKTQPLHLLYEKSSNIKNASLLSQVNDLSPCGLKKSLSEVPSQFIHTPEVNISKWTVIVDDKTLLKIAARNKRLNNLKKCKLLKIGGLIPSDLRSKSYSNEAPTRSIIINGAETITDLGIYALAENIPGLEVLEIADAQRVTDAGLRTVALKCPHLARLNLSGCPAVRGPGLGAISDHCRELKHLSLAECSQLEPWVLLRCFYGFTGLEYLNLSKCSQITDEILKALANQCPSLKTLNLTQCTLISDSGIVYIAEHCHKLKKLFASRSVAPEKITDTSFVALAEYCPELKELHISGCSFVTDAGIRWIAQGCKGMEVLDITNCMKVTDASMRSIGDNCKQLRVIRLANVKNVSDVGLRYLSSGCPSLEVLHLSNLYLVSDGNNRDFGLEGLQAVSKGCLKLKDLNLAGCFQVVERSLIALGAGCVELERLNLKACPRLTLLGVSALVSGCPMLVSLNLSGVQQCNNAMLQVIGQHCTHLKELYITNCEKVSDNGLKYLTEHVDQYEILDFSGCLLLSDIGLGYILDAFVSPSLLHLYLVGCSLITQDTIARLAFICPLLLTLSVHGCCVSGRVLHSFRSSWPLCTLKIPTSSNTVGPIDKGFFPIHRAKDKRYVEENSAIWLAAIKIQNLFRARKALKETSLAREEALKQYIVKRLQSIWRGRKARRHAAIKYLMQSGVEKSAIKIQRKYRQTRRMRKAQKQIQVVFQKQLEKYTILVQRRFRASRAMHIANLITRARRKQREKEVEAAVHLQRLWRGRKGRHQFNLYRTKKEAKEKEEKEASIRLQALYRGREDRKKAQELAKQKRHVEQLQNQKAIQIQAIYRRKLARREVERRRQMIRERELAAIKLQTAYRTRHAKQKVDIIRMAKYRIECERAAHLIQKRWRTRKDRLGLQILCNIRRNKNEKRNKAASFLQQVWRKYAIRQKAHSVVDQLLAAKRHAEEMEIWAATLVQAHWRRIQAIKEVKCIQAEKRTRWKQLVDTYNHHGKGFGAPFYYNQVNAEIRWRMPREILMLEPKPKCDQCDKPESALSECATCLEYFCEECDGIVHGHGKRATHIRRKLYNFYGIRCDHGDGEFPSIWPSEMEQDRDRGYDFFNQVPLENYNDVLWKIARSHPVATGFDEPKFINIARNNRKPRRPPSVTTTTAPPSSSEPSRRSLETPENTAFPSSTTEGETQVQTQQSKEQTQQEEEEIVILKKKKVTPFDNEQDFDEMGICNWIGFFDHSKQEQRYFHRKTKRVVSELPESIAYASVLATALTANDQINYADGSYTGSAQQNDGEFTPSYDSSSYDYSTTSGYDNSQYPMYPDHQGANYYHHTGHNTNSSSSSQWR